MEIILEIIDKAPDILVAFLAIVGGLKLFARYTKWTWDDRALEQAERIAKIALSLFKKKVEAVEEKAKEDEQG